MRMAGDRSAGAVGGYDETLLAEFGGGEILTVDPHRHYGEVDHASVLLLVLVELFLLAVPALVGPEKVADVIKMFVRV